MNLHLPNDALYRAASLTDRVPVAAAIRRATDPHRQAARVCPECDEAPPAGVVRHPHCMKRLLLNRLREEKA
jgi:hypothetical protein